MKQVLIYDVNVFPDPEIGLTPEEVIKLYEEEGVLLWDSSKATTGVDCRPKVYNSPEDMPITIIEVNSEEGETFLKHLKHENTSS
jgi:hypothetical protein